MVPALTVFCSQICRSSADFLPELQTITSSFPIGWQFLYSDSWLVPSLAISPEPGTWSQLWSAAPASLVLPSCPPALGAPLPPSASAPLVLMAAAPLSPVLFLFLSVSLHRLGVLDSSLRLIIYFKTFFLPDCLCFFGGSVLIIFEFRIL